MKPWYRENPWLAVILSASMMSALGLAFAAWHLESGNSGRGAKIEQEMAEWNRLATASPAPTEANLKAAVRHLEELQALGARLRLGVWAQGTWRPATAIENAEDLYFDLVSMVERQRMAYQVADIGLARNEQFGYGQVLRAQQVVMVDDDPVERANCFERLVRQRQAIEAILDALLRAQPSALLGVDRVPMQNEDPSVIERSEDLFLIDPSISAAVPAAIETYGARICFEGKTAALRSFLSNIQTAGCPLVVRSIEVHPAENRRESARRDRLPPPGQVSGSPFITLAQSHPKESETESRTVPIIEENDSIFTVVLEGYALPGSGNPTPVEGEGAR